MNEITTEHLSRCACVYVRQSTPGQVLNNLESKRLQYALVDRAKKLGWVDVQVIDDDLGISGAGTMRPGFERLLNMVGQCKVGAVLSTEASRLARNGRDWHTLLEFCSIVDTLIIDTEGIYDPRQSNHRLLLGMKGTISEMELSNFRQRSQEAIKQKAKRGEFYSRVPIGYVLTLDGRIDKDPDERVRSAIDLVFTKFNELGSARALYFWFLDQAIELPTIAAARSNQRVLWKVPKYHSLLSLLQNPVYAGAYVYGRTKTTLILSQGRKEKKRTKLTQPDDWLSFMPDRHEGYITYEQFQINLKLMANNVNGHGAAVRGSIKSGKALLSGLMRCGHCGGKLAVGYPSPTTSRYYCNKHILNHDISCCVMVSGLGADRLIGEHVIECLQPLGLAAALQAIDNIQGAEDDRLVQKRLALERACYDSSHAQRQFDMVDPANRQVAATLERRWNDALIVQARLEEEIAKLTQTVHTVLSEETKQNIRELAQDLPQLWNHPATTPEIRKRILRTVIKEIVATTEENSVRLLVHWQGGEHCELHLTKAFQPSRRGVTNAQTAELISILARLQPDIRIAATLNRLGLRTAHDQTWTAPRIASFRNNRGIAVYREGERQERGELSIEETATTLKVSYTTVLGKRSLNPVSRIG